MGHYERDYEDYERGLTHIRTEEFKTVKEKANILRGALKYSTSHKFPQRFIDSIEDLINYCKANGL